jgi:3-hydroxymyristoyl/3-hydroxydecanoyl-(acyl carrier protein) dehydratase
VVHLTAVLGAPPTSLVPHRPPWLLLDRVEVEGDAARGTKLVAASEPYAQGGALPAALVIEALAQAAAAVMGARAGAGGVPEGGRRGYLTEIRGFTFAGPALVGGCLEVVARRTHSLGRLHRFAARATCDGALVGEGELSFAVEA